MRIATETIGWNNKILTAGIGQAYKGGKIIGLQDKGDRLILQIEYEGAEPIRKPETSGIQAAADLAAEFAQTALPKSTPAQQAAAPPHERKTYADGTTAIGPGPLPDRSPAEQDADRDRAPIESPASEKAPDAE